MSAWSQIRERARALLFRAAEDAELEEELRFHLEQEAQRLMGEGLTRAEARRRARLALGGVAQVTEEVRAARGTLWIENLARDVRHAWRSLRRRPALTGIVVLTLAVGVGPTTAVFSLANWVLIRPVPGVAAPGELVAIHFERREGSARSSAGISIANAEDLAALVPALAGLTLHETLSFVTGPETGDPAYLGGVAVHGDYLGVLGVRPALGRWFSAEELSPTAAGDVVVVSDRFWKTHFGGSPDVLGATIRLNADPYTVIGVLPPGFNGTERLGNTDLWVPPAAYPRARHQPFDMTDRRRGLFDEVIGRLRPGATPDLVREQAAAALDALTEQYPDDNEIYREYRPVVYPGIGLHVRVRDHARRTAVLLLGIVSLLLVIACANVGSLLFARGLARRADAAMRRALGASTVRLVQQHVAEGLLISLLGALVGLLAAVGLNGLFVGHTLFGIPAVEHVGIDWRVVAFGTGAALLAGVVSSAAPTLLATRAHPLDAIKTGSPTIAWNTSALRNGLTIVQVAGSLALLVGALVLVRTVENLRRVDLGFRPENVFVLGYSPELVGYDREAGRVLKARILDELAQVPGVEAVGVTDLTPLGGALAIVRLSVPGSDRTVNAPAYAVSADYFAALGTRILAGRGFTPEEQHGDASDGHGVVLSASAARALFGEESAVGRTVLARTLMGGRHEQPVIGVTEDIRTSDLRDAPEPVVHFPLGETIYEGGSILVRTTGAPDLVAPRVREALARIDPSIPVHSGVLEDGIRRVMATELLLSRLLAVFAALAAALAGLGLFGVLSYFVTLRRREIGVRIAVGARAAAIIALVARQSLRLVMLGAMIGAAGGYGLTRMLSARLFGISAIHPGTYAAALAVFAVIGALAAIAPARQASTVDPIRALKAE